MQNRRVNRTSGVLCILFITIFKGVWLKITDHHDSAKAFICSCIINNCYCLSNAYFEVLCEMKIA